VNGLPVYTFTGRRPSGGYRWDEDVLTDGATTEMIRALGEEPAEPIEAHPALHREFAYLAPTKEAFLAFANRFGPLQGDGDSFQFWTRESAVMRGTVELAEALKDKTGAALRRRVRWETEADLPELRQLRADMLQHHSAADVDRMLRFAQVRVLRDGEITDATIHPLGVGLEDARRYAGDLQMAGKVLLLDIINARMLPRLVKGEPQGGRGVAIRFTLTGDSGVWLQLQPETLLDALWLQFGRGVMAGREYRQCANERCRGWFEISTEQHGRNRNRIYCARPSCKVEAYRARRDAASKGGKVKGGKARDRRNDGKTR
jgi:hypothetical protein